MKTKTFSVSADSITLLNVPEGKTAVLLSRKIQNITVVGPEEELKKLSEENILAKVDLSSATQTGSYDAVVYVKDAAKCWVYDTYKVKVSIR